MSQGCTTQSAPASSRTKDGMTERACGESSALNAAQGSLMRQEHVGDTARAAEQKWWNKCHIQTFY